MFTQKELGYSFEALEPFIDAKTMEIHFGKHHKGYIDKLNATLEGHSEYDNQPVELILTNIKQIPEGIRQAVINNGGGHANHTLFWEIMAPGGSKMSDEFEKLIIDNFESTDQFKEEFTNAALTRFGSGWAWLVVNHEKNLEVMSTKNQDSPLMMEYMPILGLDVWEHAYYLHYQNRRGEYVENWWNIVNWTKVEDNYRVAMDK